MLRARIRGTVVWECPNCISFQKSKLAPLQGSTLKCTECKQQWVVGVMMAKLPFGTRRFRRDPIDTVLIVDTVWRGGSRINRMLCGECATEVFTDAYEHANESNPYLESKNADPSELSTAP